MSRAGATLLFESNIVFAIQVPWRVVHSLRFVPISLLLVSVRLARLAMVVIPF